MGAPGIGWCVPRPARRPRPSTDRPLDYWSPSAAVAILPTRSGSAIASISTILPSTTAKPITLTGRPSILTITLAAPFTRAGYRRVDGRPSKERRPHACLAGDRGGPVDHHGGRAAHETRVDAQDDIRIEHGHE